MLTYKTTIELSPKLRLVVAGAVDFPTETIRIDNAHLEGDKTEENLFYCLSEPMQRVLFLKTLDELQTSIVEQASDLVGIEPITEEVGL
jgi:hypothetical protein